MNYVEVNMDFRLLLFVWMIVIKDINLVMNPEQCSICVCEIKVRNLWMLLLPSNQKHFILTLGTNNLKIEGSCQMNLLAKKTKRLIFSDNCIHRLPVSPYFYLLGGIMEWFYLHMFAEKGTFLVRYCMFRLTICGFRNSVTNIVTTKFS